MQELETKVGESLVGFVTVTGDIYKLDMVR